MPSQYEDITVPVFDAREEGWLSDCDGKREEESTSHVDLDIYSWGSCGRQ